MTKFLPSGVFDLYSAVVNRDRQSCNSTALEKTKLVSLL